jgi:large subunit ribosomal protein L19
MSVLQDIQKLAIKKKIPVIRPGYTIKVHQRIKEGEKERIQIFEGLVIKLNSGYGADKTVTVRKVFGGIGVEKVFPVYSTNIVKIEVKKKSKVRRAKLYYMRKRSGKSARLKETFVSDKEESVAEGSPKSEEPQAEKEAEVQTEAPPAEETKAEEAPPAEEPPKE